MISANEPSRLQPKQGASFGAYDAERRYAFFPKDWDEEGWADVSAIGFARDPS